MVKQKLAGTQQSIAEYAAGLGLESSLRELSAAEHRRQARARLLLRISENYDNRGQGSRADNLEKALAACASALGWLTREANPVLWAQTHHTLGRLYYSRIQGNKAGNIEKAIAHHQAALTVRTRGAFPLDWAKTQNNLAVVYCRRLVGARADNLEHAIAASKAALTVRTREEFPIEWAETQSNLASAYANRCYGEQADNLEQAIAAYEAALTIYTREGSADDWARTHEGLASAFRRRVRGTRSDNIDHAIVEYEAALTVYTRESYPLDRARVLNNLAIAYSERINGERSDNLERAIAHCTAALEVYIPEAFPSEWATTQNNLANAYLDRIQADRGSNLECAISHYEASLTVHTPEAFPLNWARAQNNLAIAFMRRIRGRRADNLEAAIAHCNAALEVYTRQTCPIDWAMAQNNLAIAYANRICGERADNVERAIAAYEAAMTVYTRDDFPTDWAMIQNNLAIACRARVRGERVMNLDRGIAHHEAALTIFSPHGQPSDWAMTQNNLALAYADRIRGERADNLERAIAAYEAALTVYTRETFPTEWAMTQSNLASSYRRRLRGERADNLEHAIALYEAALAFYSREAFPYDWARTQSNLAIAYSERIVGDRAHNLECAIAHNAAALTVYTRDAFPADWAATQSNLAYVYALRIRGERANNVECGIAHYEAALTVYTRENFPEQWAIAQNNLAIAIAGRIRGDHQANLERAVAIYEAVMRTINTRETCPRGHLETCQNLGQAFLAQRAWHKAAQAFAEARETFLLLFGEGLDEAEARDLIEIAGPLFTNAAYAACELCDPTQAFRLVCEGKARLLATALRLQTLDLPPETRRRFECLRTEIRERSRELEQAQGLQRVGILDQIKRLRAELSAIIASSQSTLGRTDALAQATALVSQKSALIAPIATEIGGKLIIATAGQGQACPVVTAVDLPQLTTQRVKGLIEGPDGWLEAFARDLPGHEIKMRATCAVEKIGSELWEILADAIERTFADLGVASGARLIFLPSGGLGLLPLGLAQEPTSGKRLLECYDIITAPSLAALSAPPDDERTSPSLAAIINPTGDLIYAPIEGVLVAAHFKAENRTFLNEVTATPDTVLKALKGKTHWHFSTHGTFIREAPRRSALAMKAGASLSVGTLLEAQDLGRPRLVVLSACETGLHDTIRTPEEFIGLPGAFMTVGAQAVLGTLWPVDDRATAMLTARFYDLHLNEGLAPAAALSKAQTWLKSAPRKDLSRYVRAAERLGRLSARQARDLDSALTRRDETVRFFAVAKTDPGGIAASDPSSHQNDRRRPGPPFAHPIYWGGFIVTGL